MSIVLQCYIVDLYTYNLGLGKVFNLNYFIDNTVDNNESLKNGKKGLFDFLLVLIAFIFPYLIVSR